MKSLSILLVDDDEIERLKFKKVSQKVNFDCSIFEAKNGEKALTFLDSNSSLDVIITDLNMPRMDGFEFLNSLKNNTKFKSIPVVVMSTSERKIDLERCYEFGISGYFSKPLKYSEYVSKVTSLLQYWEKATLSSRLNY
mgnify:FL=1